MAIKFNSISDLKKYIGGAGNPSLHINSLNPHIDPTARKHLIEFIGQAQYDAIDPQNAPSALDDYVLRPLAFLLMYEYVQVNAIQISEIGNLRVESDEKKTAFKYQENQYKNYMLHTGYEEIETLLRYLDANSGSYPLWTASEAFKRHRGIFLNCATDFRASYSKYLSRYTFELLRPLIEDLEFFALVPTIGEPLFKALRAEKLANTLADNRLKAVFLIQKAIANFVMEEAVQRHWVRFEGRNVVQTETLENQGYDTKMSAKDSNLAQKMRHHEEWGNRHLSYLITFLKENIADFQEYQTHLDAQTAAEKATTEENTCNYHVKPNCNCNDCNCQSQKTKGIILL
jgi:hypothetical protein